WHRYLFGLKYTFIVRLLYTLFGLLQGSYMRLVLPFVIYGEVMSSINEKFLDKRHQKRKFSNVFDLSLSNEGGVRLMTTQSVDLLNSCQKVRERMDKGKHAEVTQHINT